MLFGAVYGFLALEHSELLFGSIFLMAVGAVTLVTYALLAARYWFYAPLGGISLSLALYLGGIALH